jgi:IMP dehydrogenase
MCIAPTTTIGEVHRLKDMHGFGGFPVTSDGQLGSKLLGIVTDRDYDFRTGA